jgi:hypothetical protein
MVDDVDPNRLDAPSSHGDAKELSALGVIQNRHADFEVVSLLGGGRAQEVPCVRPRRIGDQEPTENKSLSNRHENGLSG